MRNLMMKRIEEYADCFLDDYLEDFNVSRLDLLSNSELIDLFEILIEDTE